MQALLLTDYRRLELTELDCPPLGPRDVLVRVAACGICGSDVHGYDGSTGRRIPPLVMGHEAAGVIEDVGSHVSRARVGERVTFDSTISCGQCDSCSCGQINLCTRRRVLGVSCDEYRQHGAFAEFVAVPEHILYPLPNGMPFEHAAFIEPVSVAVHAVDRVAAACGLTGRSAVVVGSGMIGLLVIQALRHAGCEHVIAIDIDNGRLQLANELGATHTINSSNADPSGGWGSAPDGAPISGALPQPPDVDDRPQPPAGREVLKLTGGKGVDIAMDVAGNASAMATAIGCVRRGGHVGLVGNVSPEVPLPLQAVVSRELTLLGSCASAGEYPKAIELVASGAIRVGPLTSAVAPLADGPVWFERLYNREPGLMKVILKPNSQSQPNPQ